MMIHMKDVPKEERPYEKCLIKGADALSDSELLAVILRTGVRGSSCMSLAAQVLNLAGERYQGLLGLHHLTIKELMEIPGVGEVKAVQLKCIGELAKRMARLDALEGLSFQNPSSIAQYYMEQLRHEEQEVLLCMMLDSKNHLLGEKLMSKGTVNSTLLSPRELFLEALRFHAVNLILIHNHPSGDPSPSSADIGITRRIFRAGELLDIHLLDHIVIGNRRYISMREERLVEEFTG